MRTITQVYFILAILIKTKGVYMRKNFAQILRSEKIDIKLEYEKLYSMFYDPDPKDGKSFANIISTQFLSIPFRGTCLSLEEFDIIHEINFDRQPQELEIEDLVDFCEYFYNFAQYINDRFYFNYFNKTMCLAHILQLIDKIGYIMATESNITIFVPKDNVAIAVSEMNIFPPNTSYKIISYGHHSMKGDIDRKRQTLLFLSNLLEPKRDELETIDKQFTKDLFYAFNTFDIRHNNVDKCGTKYKKVIGDLTEEEKEIWYDETYRMCLLAFMKLEQEARKEKFKQFKQRIENA